MPRNLLTYLSLTILGLLMACSSDSVVEEIKDTDQDQGVPMTFGMARQDAMTTRASAPLENEQTTFGTYAYKYFGSTTQQQTVMDYYQVNYNPTDKWHYEGAAGTKKTGDTQDFAKTQYIKFWDMSAFPYEFVATTPYSSDVTIDGTTFKLPTAAKGGAFSYETYNNGTLTGKKEPFMLAQLERQEVTGGTGWRDVDQFYPSTSPSHVIKTFSDFSVKSADPSTNASVNLRFHHLLSKVGFRIHVSDGNVGTERISYAMVNIISPNFITGASDYSAAFGAGKSIFDGNFANYTKTNKTDTILINDFDAHAEELADHKTKETAFNLESYFDSEGNLLNSPDGLVMIPQSGIKLHLKIKINDHLLERTIPDHILDASTMQVETLTWEKNTYYIYYLNIRDLHRNYIDVTEARLNDWQSVSGNMDVSLEHNN